jgi:hypothetical protein
MLSTLTSSEYYTLWALPKPQQEGLPGLEMGQGPTGETEL